MSAYYIGLMSGTSMDGIDAALVDFSQNTPKLISSCCTDYDDVLLLRLATAIAQPNPSVDDIKSLSRETAIAFANASNALIKSSPLQADDITAIGSHGQTIRHEPNIEKPYSLQVGSGKLIQQLTQIQTVTDFRSADIAAGGQGAPLVPAFHQAVLQTPLENRVVVNIGGIANITYLPADTKSAVIGFDTGPGNTLMDQWIQQHQGDKFDRNGDWAAQGSIIGELLERLLSDPYFSKAPPKSTGLEYFNLNWLNPLLSDDYAALDVQATLNAFTAHSIIRAIQNHAANIDRLLVCGGGTHNTELINHLNQLMNSTPVESTLAFGIDPDWMEAMAFAWLAKQHIENKPGNIPTVTGAKQAVVLGQLHT